jgi:two-component system NtrC family sensor kinase
MSEPTIVDLERKIKAKDKIIASLMRRVEGQLNQASSSLSLLYQNISLEQMVQRKTKELEDALRQLQSAQAELLQAQKLTAIGQLAAGIAHEINTPLQYITDNILFVRDAFDKLVFSTEAHRHVVKAIQEKRPFEDELKRAVDTQKKLNIHFLVDEVPNALEQCDEGLKRVTTIVSSMREFSHPSGGSLVPTNIQRAIESTMTVARNVWKYIADFETDFAPGLPLVPCMRDEFNQVILNLIVNASDAISDVTKGGANGKGKIKISVYTKGDWLEVTLSDTGGGIPEGIQKRVFEPFFTTKPVGKGTGQGLAIAYSVIADKHKGKISFSSVSGVGTTFTILLPLTAPETT